MNKKFKKNERIMLYLQILLIITLMVFGIITMFNNYFYDICKLLIGIIMFVLAYNNQKIFKRKYMTMVYFGLGIIILGALLFA